MKKNNDTNDGFEPILPTSNEEGMKRMMKELDREQSYREHKCWRQYITVVISVIFVVFQLYATLSGSIPAQILRASHLAFVQLLASDQSTDDSQVCRWHDEECRYACGASGKDA